MFTLYYRDNVVRMCNESALQAASEVIGGGVHSTPPNSVETGALVVKKGTSKCHRIYYCSYLQ